MNLTQRRIDIFIELCVQYDLPAPSDFLYDISAYSTMDDEKTVAIVIVSCWEKKWDLISAFYYWQQYRRKAWQAEKVVRFDRVDHVHR